MWTHTWRGYQNKSIVLGETLKILSSYLEQTNFKENQRNEMDEASIPFFRTVARCPLYMNEKIAPISFFLPYARGQSVWICKWIREEGNDTKLWRPPSLQHGWIRTPIEAVPALRYRFAAGDLRSTPTSYLPAATVSSCYFLTIFFRWKVSLALFA